MWRIFYLHISLEDLLNKTWTSDSNPFNLIASSQILFLISSREQDTGHFGGKLTGYLEKLKALILLVWLDTFI